MESQCRRWNESGDIAKFNEDYAEIQELISNGQLREASEGALAAVPLAEVVFDSDLENLANYYYLVAQLQAAQPWSGNMLEVLPIAEKAVAIASNLYGSNSEKALRARGGGSFIGDTNTVLCCNENSAPKRNASAYCHY